MLPSQLLPLALRLGLTNQDTVDAAAVERLVTDKIVEDDNIDFKKGMYASGDAGSNELAKDIAAFANHRGGVIVIGVHEVNGVAVSVHPFTGGDPTQRRVVSVHNSRVRPTVAGVLAEWVPTTPGAPDGFLLIGIPASPLAPHAVGDQNQKALSFPVRDNSQSRYMSEVELSTRYARRFASADATETRARTLFAEAAPKLDHTAAWVQMSVVPDAPGDMHLGDRAHIRLLQWHAKKQLKMVWDNDFIGSPEPAIGHRRVTFALSSHKPSKHYYADLHSDGSTYVARQLNHKSDWATLTPEDEQPAHFVGLHELLSYLMAMLRFAATHATENASTSGSAHLLATIRPARGDARLPLVLGVRGGIEEVVSNTRSLSDVPTIERVVSLDAIVMDASEWMRTTKSLADEVVQCFGLDEVTGITAAGELDLGRWPNASAVAKFAGRYSIPTAT